MKNKVKIAVIGGGASGMTAAITAARQGAEVTLFEKNDRVGKKLLATGNGKCNLGSMEFSMDQYYCSDKEKLQKIFNVFSPRDTVSFFESMGLMIKEKNKGLYPYSEQASAVLDTLRMELVHSKVQVITNAEIKKAAKQGDRALFQVTAQDGTRFSFDRLILASGSGAGLNASAGDGYNIAKSFGHQVNPLMPGLVQLKSDETFCKALGGVRCSAKLTLMISGTIADEESGELQFTEYGISGIPVFQFSRQAGYALKEQKDVTVFVDFFPEQPEEAFAFMARLRYESWKERTLEEFLIGTLNKKINMALIKRCGLKPGMRAEEAGYEKVMRLMQMSRNFPIHICGVNTMKNAQVCAGGVEFGELNETMESKLVPGLFFTGEIVDVDGKCGGYNLQWAWSSGYAAGMSAAGVDLEAKEASNGKE
ncbi:MAG: NAD(P)/FAD-dependent oxidoreductase [Lachnospiraceae bacterium]|nr:NAD(P)/FAD-dependent oxidoreductase [Lachnospiraceae bacterium]